MFRNVSAMLFILVSISFILGCASAKIQPMTPSDNAPSYDTRLDSIRSDSEGSLLGIWDVSFDTDKLTSNIEPVRNSSLHYNLTRLLPAPQITINSYDPLTETVNVDVKIVNPFNIQAYDVRLIIYYDSVKHKLLNEDNWTNLYTKSGQSPINPFKAYRKNDPDRIFPALSDATENLVIKIPNGNPKVTFAIDGNFPNHCPEPYRISNFQQGILYDTTTSSTQISTDVYDWSGAVNYVAFYCPSLGVNFENFIQESTNLWSMTLENHPGVPEGDYTGYVVGRTSSSGTISLVDVVNVHVSTQTTHKIKSIKFVAKDPGDEYYDVGVFPAGNVYVCADHVVTGNVDSTRTAIRFNNDLSVIETLNEGTGMNDPSGYGLTMFWNRIDVTDGGLLVTNSGYQTINNWQITDATATAVDGSSLSCFSGWPGCRGIADVWNQSEPSLGSFGIGFAETQDCPSTQWAVALLMPDADTAGFGGMSIPSMYGFATIAAIQGVDGTENSIFFISSDNSGKLSLSGSWLARENMDVAEIKSVGSFGMSDGQFFGGLDAAIDSNGNIVTLEDHGSGVYRFQKFDSDLNWIYSSMWADSGSPKRMDFDHEDDHLYLITDSGIHIMQVE